MYLAQLNPAVSESLKFLLVLLIAAVSVYSLICIYLFLAQKRLIHIPTGELIGDPLEHGMDFEEIVLATADDARLHGWFVPHSDSKYTVWMFAGNAGNMSYMLDAIRLIHDLKLSVFIYDYRGFGNSTGNMTEQAMYSDTEAVWDYLTQTRQIPHDRIILHGRSLGTAMASWIAAKTEPAGLIIESGFTSIDDMAADLYKLFPTKLLLRWNYNNLERISKVRSPILIIHSPDDELTPYSHALQLLETASDNTDFLQISGDHLNGFLTSGDVYTDGIAAFVDQLAG